MRPTDGRSWNLFLEKCIEAYHGKIQYLNKCMRGGSLRSAVYEVEHAMDEIFVSYSVFLLSQL